MRLTICREHEIAQTYTSFLLFLVIIYPSLVTVINYVPSSNGVSHIIKEVTHFHCVSETHFGIVIA